MTAEGRVSEEEHAVFQALEVRLSNPGLVETRESLADLLGSEFREFGSSGRRFDRDTVLEALVPGGRPEVAMEDFQATTLATGVVLVTYLSRSTAGAGWKPPALRSSR